MNLTSKEIIKNLNERLLMQSVIVETLCDLLIDSGIVGYDDLENLIKQNLESQKTKAKELQQKLPISIKINDTDVNEAFAEMEDELYKGLYFGPVGEA